MREPRRVRVEGDLFHPVVPSGAIYVGRQGPYLRRSPFANPFGLRTLIAPSSPLRSYLVAGIADAEGRAPGKWAETQSLKACTPGVAVAAYRRYLAAHPDLIEAARTHLAGRDIACWCPEPDPGLPDLCHGAEWIEVVNA